MGIGTGCQYVVDRGKEDAYSSTAASQVTKAVVDLVLYTNSFIVVCAQ